MASSENNRPDDQLQKKHVPAANITIFPRFFGFSFDAPVFGMEDARMLQPFFHNYKDSEVVRQKFSIAPDGCPAKGAVSGKKADPMGKRFLALEQRMLRDENRPAGDAAPFWRNADPSCFDRLWCPPLPIDFGGPWPVASVKVNESLETYVYEDPGSGGLNPMLSKNDGQFEPRK